MSIHDGRDTGGKELPRIVISGFDAVYSPTQLIDMLAARMAMRIVNIPAANMTMSKEPHCEICGKLPEHYGNGYIMPYGSKFDGDYVCGDCLITELDAAIANAHEMKVKE